MALLDGARRVDGGSHPWGIVTVSPAQLEKLYRESGRVIYRRCLTLLRDNGQAEDATHDVFLKVARDLPRLTDPDRLLPWLYRIATHHCLDLISSAAHRRDRESAVLAWEVRTASPLDAYPSRKLVADMLRRFDTETQAVAVGVLVDGMEYQEVAAALGVSRRTVARRLSAFLERAQAELLEAER